MYTYFIYIALSRAHVSQFPRIYLNRDYTQNNIFLLLFPAPAPALILSDTNLCLTPTPLLFIAPWSLDSPLPLYLTICIEHSPPVAIRPHSQGGTEIVRDFHRSPGLGGGI